MKMLIATALVSLFATQSYAAEVRSARLDASKKHILLDVSYGGGCGEHKFSLKMGLCQETYPVRCFAELVHETNDRCEAYIHTTVALPLSDYDLNDSYFKGGSLTITGDKDWQTNKPSSATVRLP